ncbi:MAG TPA: nucleotide exchange factor GrpE [Candidatus Saccharimonadales bacterium]|nr:nucleotide exchange factor GrpE [Candidatus Saccharimonadales bacterium]
MTKAKDKTPSAKDDLLQPQIDQLTADLQRMQADFINFKRRSEQEQERLSDMAKVAVVMKFLPFVDNVKRALAHMPKELENDQWAKGVVQLGAQFTTILDELGVRRIEAVGHPFDPNLHEAVSVDDEAGEGEEVVVEELQPGYELDGFVLRHSVVKVGKRTFDTSNSEERN